MKLPADLLARPAEEAVRRLALVQLEKATAARAQLIEGDRDEALHDFRVALRRLRSLLRSHRGAFTVGFPKKSVRRLGALARGTNPGRDAEVQLAWLATLEGGLRTTERAGYRELVRELALRRDESYRELERAVARDFARLGEELGARLLAYQVHVDLERPSRPPSFAGATREALTRARDDAFDKLDRIAAVADEAAGHAARIAAKRLRYLVEPLAPWIEAAARPVELLKGLQDLLGELRDGQLLAAHVGEALAKIESKRAQKLIASTLEASGAQPAPPSDAPVPPPVGRRERAGLIAVARRLGARRSELFRLLERDWLGTDAPRRDELRAALERLDENLASRSGRRTPRPQAAPATGPPARKS